MRKGLAHLVIILVIALVVIGGLTYYALSSPGKKTSELSPSPSVTPVASPTATVAPTHRTVTSEEVIFDVPVDWTEAITDPSASMRVYTYAHPTSGDYARVQVSSTGTGDSAPVSIWHYKLSGKALVPVQETADCDPDRSMCSRGGGKLLIGVMIDGLVDQKINQRIYSVSFGNSKTEAANRQVFRDIMKTAKLK